MQIRKYSGQNDRKLGDYYESLACQYLEMQGVEILERNFRIRHGEIDIIGKDKNVLIFFEVKYRKNSNGGYAQEAVGIKKQRQISKVALFYYSFNNISIDMDTRFDVIAINGLEIEWIRNAFEFHK